MSGAGAFCPPYQRAGWVGGGGGGGDWGGDSGKISNPTLADMPPFHFGDGGSERCQSDRLANDSAGKRGFAVSKFDGRDWGQRHAVWRPQQQPQCPLQIFFFRITKVLFLGTGSQRWQSARRGAERPVSVIDSSSPAQGEEEVFFCWYLFGGRRRRSGRVDRFDVLAFTRGKQGTGSQAPPPTTTSQYGYSTPDRICRR